ncbi:MAG TPA: sensor histidine kinase [Lacunisphaera sp.]|jgi:signal transduction histidine kinase
MLYGLRKFVFTAVALAALALPALAAEPIHGQPFTRAYPFDEIGYVSRGARLSFDSFGRLALVQAGAYAVLNDTVWLNLSARSAGTPDLAAVVRGPDGRTYYGARGAWGIVEFDAEGKLRPVPFLPEVSPKWLSTAFFDNIIVTEGDVYFGSWHGIVQWNVARKIAQFFETGPMAKIFRVGERVFVSVEGEPISRVDIQQRGLRPVAGTGAPGLAVQCAAPLDESHTLISFSDGRLMSFDGQTLVPWEGQSRNGLTGRISALQELADGGMAVAVLGRGLYLFSADGHLMLSLTTDQYHLVTGLAAREAGVIWVATENAIEKVLYGGALTTFGERLGLPVGWPMVRRWGDHLVVTSDGKLYEAVPGVAGAMTRFELMKDQPAGGAWAFATNGGQVLVGNRSGIFIPLPDGGFERITTVKDLLHLVMVRPGLCYAIGPTEIAALQLENGKWVEHVPRIPGMPYLAVPHAVGEAVWVEMGPEGVARISLQDGALKLRQVKTPWPRTPWVNLGSVDDTVILTGTEGERKFFDEKAQSWIHPAWLEALLARSPFWIVRAKQDAKGTIWATHRSGVVTFTPKGGDYEMDSSRFDLGNDRDPAVHIMDGGDVWISTERSLYHVEANPAPKPAQTRLPVLVSVWDARKNREISAAIGVAADLLKLSYDQNSLVFRPFSGGYAWRLPPAYFFRLDQANQWTEQEAGSTLSLSDLREGRHLLEIQTAENRDTNSAVKFAFEILPPWYRTWPAYFFYGLAGVILIFTVVGLASYLARRRHRVLEALVQARTNELEVAMERLNEETRNTATLVERDRLAGEIHDSMQQGLSGAIIQLDTTLKMRAVTEEVRSRLNVVRNMISYARHEVQHAVWDMESPLIEGTELGEALRKITALVNVGTVVIETLVAGEPVDLPRTAKHNLLRIAQEATTNAVRHAEAGHITIAVRYAPEGISLAIIDDGVGFVPDEVRSKTFGHFGLRGMRSRAEKIGGTLVIESMPGAGTIVRIFVPGTDNPAPAVFHYAEAHTSDKNTHSPG